MEKDVAMLAQVGVGVEDTMVVRVDVAGAEVEVPLFSEICRTARHYLIKEVDTE